jgi:CRP-like cAMP-binding protein
MSALLIRKLTLRDSTLSEQSRNRLLSSLNGPVAVKAGGEIVLQGSRPTHSTLVLSGWTSRYSLMPDGRRQTLALHISGDFVDLHSFPIKVMDHGVQALTDCMLSTLEHSVIREITESDAHLSRVLWLHTLVDAAILRQWLLSSGQRSSLEHAAHLLCELFTRLRVVGLAAPGSNFELPLSQQQFADALGISAVHVSRTITELRHRNLLQWRSGTAQVLDWEGLRELAQFDPTYLVLHDEPR